MCFFCPKLFSKIYTLRWTLASLRRAADGRGSPAINRTFFFVSRVFLKSVLKYWFWSASKKHFFFLLRRLKSLKSLSFFDYKNALVSKKTLTKSYMISLLFSHFWHRLALIVTEIWPSPKSSLFNFLGTFFATFFYWFFKKYVIPYSMLDLAPLRAWCVWHLFVLYSWFFASSNVMRVSFLLFDWAPFWTLQISITIMLINCFVCDILYQLIGSSPLSCW